MTALGVALIGAQVLTVSIDPSIWTQVDRIAWPGNERNVLVLGPTTSRYVTECGVLDLAGASKAGYSFRLGEHCHRLIVFMNLSGGVTDQPRAEQFLSEHESFHVAAQMYGSKVPVEFMGVDPGLVRGFSGSDRFKNFYTSIEDLFASEMNGDEASCAYLEASYKALDPGAREYLDYKIFWEWPAEYYAQKAVFHDDFVGYSKFRSQLFSEGNDGFELFVSGVKTGMILDKVMGRERWQEMAAEGASMLDLLLGHYGCHPIPRSLPVRMKRVDFS